MNKKLLLKYILMYIPMVAGGVLFSNGVVNLFSSLLLFLGGYVAVKNTLDYRLVKRNINSVKTLDSSPSKLVLEEAKEEDKTARVAIKSMNPENIVGIKRTRRYTRVRRRY